ncbi:MAG: DUF5946 family protein, partial [Gammaproteobacteria bacterium]|nr:DUF5946 family protein [Gammaproteobacteria bacterium]
THRYMLSSPGCWATYGEILAKEYSSTEYFQIHRLGVDAYAVQHPGKQDKQSIHSVGVHLIRLYLCLEQGVPAEKANEAMLKITQHKSQYIWLSPPESMGEITAADIVKETTVEGHVEATKAWARSAWEAWSDHHPQIIAWSRL